MTENTIIEFKSLRKIIDTQGKLKTDGLRDLAITCVSLANSKGGEIIFGIEDNDQEPPAGQIIQDSIINETITRLRTLCFSVSLILKGKEKHSNGSDYFTIIVQPSLKSIATTSDGKVFIRIGDQCQPARSEDLVHLASEKDAFQWELQLRNITIDQLPANNIQWFCSEIRNSDRVKVPVKEMSDIELLEHYNLVTNNSVTNIGVLWLGAQPNEVG
jgi:ATP-dependent DNA helicase RecG